MAFASASRTAVSISNSLPGAHFIARAISRTPSTTGFMALGSAGIVMFSLQAEQTGMSPLSRLTFSKDIRSSLSNCSRCSSTKSRSHKASFSSPKLLRSSSWACTCRLSAELHSRREAQCCLDRDLNKANSGRQRVESKMKFRNFIEGRWINVLPTYKLSTRLQYRYFMDRHLLPYFGEWKLEDIPPEEVQRFLRLLPKLAPKTARSMAAALSLSLRTAATWGYFETNPVKGVSIPAKR